MLKVTDHLAPVDVQALEEDLRTHVRGEVRFDDGSRAMYATDASNYRQVPIGVVIPLDAEDIIQTVAACRRHQAPVLSRGGGTSLCGQCCNVAVVMDMSKYYNRILALDPDRKIARVQPGCVLDDLRAAAEKYNLTFAPDPSTHNHNTLGGMIGNNSCGVHSVMGGRTADNVIALDVLTYEGERFTVGQTSEEEYQRIIAAGGAKAAIYQRLKALIDRYGEEVRRRFPDIPRRVSGYGLDELLPENHFNVARALVGTEGTCVVVLEAVVRLIDSPPARSLLVLGYPDVFHAGDHIPEVMQTHPTGCEGMDDSLIKDMEAVNLHQKYLKLLPPGHGWLLVEYGGQTKEESDNKARAVMEELKQKPNPPSMKLFDNPQEEHDIWLVRRSGLGATAHVPNKKITWEGWEDAAVPPDKVGDYLRDFRKLLDKYHYTGDLYGHFGQGCIHTRIDFDLETAEGIQTFESFLHEAAHLVVSYGGSISGEHGDGQSKAELLPIMFGNDLIEAFNEFKSIWDPLWKMNPGKVVRPYKADQNLRLGTDYNPPVPVTFFKFPADDGNFNRVTLRCVGTGECRRHYGGTICPSYRVTREEMHSTRGRAHLMFEMMKGEVITGGWKDEHVKEAMHYCLACKGCKGDCPVKVDMATYKAEFLAHYYDGRLRPIQDYAFGMIYRWSRLAAWMPTVVNLLTQTPGLRSIAKSLVNMAPERRIPEYAPETFKEWFFRRAPKNQDKPRVILWPDTFNNHFHPETAKAAVEVLEHAGFQVTVPTAHLCCGRSLYDSGQLERAQGLLRQILDTLQDEIRNGVPIIGLEPACTAVFRDELTNLYPDDENAKRLSSQTFTLAEFLDKHNYQPPQLKRKAIVHGHCHHKAIMGMDADQRLLQKTGLEFQILDDGCCGMAGSFGFEKSKYDVSIKVGETGLLPHVRQAGDETLVITDGFSCREQIAQTTDRRGLHLAQVLQMALHGAGQVTGERPEAPIERRLAQERMQAKKRLAAVTSGVALLGVAWLALRRRK